jgi:spore coat polysaccharide biosynthesis protein SpsF
LQLVNNSNCEYFVRITADDPFKDPMEIFESIRSCLENNLDYFCNFSPRVIPIGLDSECVSSIAFRRAISMFHDSLNQEHVTSGLRESGLFRTGSSTRAPIMENLRLTIDDGADLKYCDKVARELERADPRDFSLAATLRAVDHIANGQ